MVGDRLLEAYAGRDEALQVLEPPLPVEGFAIGLVWHERTHQHPAHRWVRERLRTLCGE